MAEFRARHHNRLRFPTKHVVVAEDDLENQAKFATHFSHLLEPQGIVQVDFCCSGVGVAAILSHMNIDLLVLDHDLPHGNASDLLAWMAENEKTSIPILTASGIPENNEHMRLLCIDLGLECYKFWKPEVYSGKADVLIKSLLKI